MNNIKRFDTFLLFYLWPNILVIKKIQAYFFGNHWKVAKYTENQRIVGHF